MINRRRLLLLRTFILLSGIRLGLALLPFQRLRQIVERLSHVSTYHQRSRGIPLPPRLIRQIVWAVEKSAQLTPGGAKCLAKALTTQVLMGRRGLSCDFKIGVAKSPEGQLEAHAWIEVNGQVIMGALPDLERFTSLPTLDKPSIL